VTETKAGDRQRKAILYWRRRLSERAFVAMNLPLAGIVATFAFASFMTPSGRYIPLALMLAVLALPWQIMVFVLRGVMLVQTRAVVGRGADPAVRARLAAAGACGWIIGGAAAGLWIAVTPLVWRLAGFRNESLLPVALLGLLFIGPLLGLLISWGNMEREAERLAAEGPDFRDPLR
jgi:hypothetical protein